MNREYRPAAVIVLCAAVLLLVPIPKGSVDLGTTKYVNATLVSASFEEAHCSGSVLHHHCYADAWETTVRIGDQTITSDSRAVYDSIVTQNRTRDLVVKVSEIEVTRKAALFMPYTDIKYSLVE